jgi:hypothetical protein
MRERGSSGPFPVFGESDANCRDFQLQAGINVAGAAALRDIAAYVFELTGFFAFRAGLGRSGGLQGIAALGALPVDLRLNAHLCFPFAVRYWKSRRLHAPPVPLQ